MSQNQTVARPYAKAAFELALAEKALAKWSEMLSSAALIARDKQMVGLMKNPNFSSEDIIGIFLALGKDVFNQEMHNFINTLARFKRLAFLPEIAEIFDAMRANAERTIHVQLICAFPINEDYQQRLANALKRRTNCEVSLECFTDKSILGGAIIRAGDLVIDGSVRGRLAKISDAVGISF
jgi:F-type H+-transporting ATPase subunit delta